MKKLISILLLFVFIITISGCNKMAANNSSLDSTSKTVALTSNQSSEADASSAYGSFENASVSSKDVESGGAASSFSSTNSKSKAANTVSKTPSQVSPNSSAMNGDALTEEYYENLTRNYPVNGEREWIFRSTDKNYKARYDDSDLAECAISVNESGHAIVTWNYYYDLEKHPEFLNAGDRLEFEGKTYSWFLRYMYEGTFFPEQGGFVSIELKCTNDWGANVNDDISFKREGPNKLVVISHRGMEFNLFKGDEFFR